MKTISVVFLLLLTFIFSSLSIFVFFPEEPTTDKQIKELLESLYHEAEEFEINQYLQGIKLLEKNRTTFLKLKEDGSYEENVQLPIKLLQKIGEIFHGNSPHFRVDRNGVISLSNHETDHKNYLYVIRFIEKINTFKSSEKSKYQRSVLLDDKYLYSITIEDAFWDIDPNNFAPN